jgi:hypothetical protein
VSSEREIIFIVLFVAFVCVVRTSRESAASSRIVQRCTFVDMLRWMCF